MPAIKYAAAVNLGNYESLRVEVEGEDPQTAKMALDQALAAVQGDADNPAVVDAIVRYRKGVLGRSAPEPAEPAPMNKYDNKMPNKSSDDDLSYKGAEKPAQEAREPVPTPAAKRADGEEICEKCGCAVSKTQGKLSRLFMNKSLCKKCMEVP